MSEYKFRPYRAGDEKEITDLLSKVFHGWPHIDTVLSPLEYWKWKFQKNPTHPSLVTIGLDGAKIISSHHSMVLKLKIMDKRILGRTGVDFAVHPDHRRQGLSQRTSAPTRRRGIEDGLLLSYFITRNPILIKSFDNPKKPNNKRKRFPLDLVNVTRIHDVELHFEHIPVKNQWIIKPGVKALKTINKIVSNPMTHSDLKVHEIYVFDSEIDEFLDRVVEEHNFMIIRSSEYLNWKYAYPGLDDYRIHLVKENEKIVGYSVLRINKYNPEYPIGYIVDLVTMTGRDDVVSILAEHAVNYFDNNDVNIVNYHTVRGHPHIDVLSGYGFLDSRIKIHLYYTAEEGVALGDLTDVDPASVYLSWGDYDALPVSLSRNI